MICLASATLRMMYPFVQFLKFTTSSDILVSVSGWLSLLTVRNNDLETKPITNFKDSWESDQHNCMPFTLKPSWAKM